MAFRLEQPMSPRGSTAWGAAQFYRLLDEQECATAERARSNLPVFRRDVAAEGLDAYQLWCALDPQSCIIGQIFRRDRGAPGGSCPQPDCGEVRQECHEECAPLYVGGAYGSDAPLLHRRCVRECMEDQGCFDY